MYALVCMCVLVHPDTCSSCGVVRLNADPGTESLMLKVGQLEVIYETCKRKVLMVDPNS